MSEESNFNILRYESVESTNIQLKSLRGEKEYTVVLTNDQTAGKGQAGNSWESEPRKNLTFSILLKPIYIEIQDQFIISKAIALGIIKILKKHSPDFSIKWPNDIYYQNKKIGGILIENALCQNVISESIIGIGLNINQTTFISDAPNPISLKNITANDFDINKLLHEILQSIVIYIDHIKSGDITFLNNLYFDNLYQRRGLHSYKDKEGKFNASITGINQYGHLELKTDKGEKRSYAFKEVEFIID